MLTIYNPLFPTQSEPTSLPSSASYLDEANQTLSPLERASQTFFEHYQIDPSASEESLSHLFTQQPASGSIWSWTKDKADQVGSSILSFIRNPYQIFSVSNAETAPQPEDKLAEHLLSLPLSSPELDTREVCIEKITEEMEQQLQEAPENTLTAAKKALEVYCKAFSVQELNVIEKQLESSAIYKKWEQLIAYISATADWDEMIEFEKGNVLTHKMEQRLVYWAYHHNDMAMLNNLLKNGVQIPADVMEELSKKFQLKLERLEQKMDELAEAFDSFENTPSLTDSVEIDLDYGTSDEEILKVFEERSRLYSNPMSKFTIEGSPVLGYIAAHGKLTTLQAFIRAGADINEANAQGRTPLMRAVNSGNHDNLRELLKLGARTDLTSRKGETALSIAREKDDQEAIDLLKAAGKKRSGKAKQEDRWEEVTADDLRRYEEELKAAGKKKPATNPQKDTPRTVQEDIGAVKLTEDDLRRYAEELRSGKYVTHEYIINDEGGPGRTKIENVHVADVKFTVHPSPQEKKKHPVRTTDEI